jgi:hypothetical protein
LSGPGAPPVRRDGGRQVGRHGVPSSEDDIHKLMKGPGAGLS